MFKKKVAAPREGGGLLRGAAVEAEVIPGERIVLYA